MAKRSMKRYRRIGKRLDAKLAAAEEIVLLSKDSPDHWLDVAYRDSVLELLGARRSFADPHHLLRR